MTIHSEHPFLPEPEDRSPVRRWRGRLPAPVTIVATGRGADRVGLTVSSLVIVDGEPAHIVVWIDPDSDLADELVVGSSLTVTQLIDGDDYLADAFAGTVPAPGGPFTIGEWRDVEAGPVLVDRTWLAATVTEYRELGWSRAVTARIAHMEFAAHDTLTHVRGRYR